VLSGINVSCLSLFGNTKWSDKPLTSVGVVGCGCCGMWALWDVGVVGCGRCRMWALWDAGAVGCGRCGMWALWDVG
jgi:hypothetical protein